MPKTYPGFIHAIALFIVLIFTGSHAQAGQVRLTWKAPVTNADGTPLTDLAGYNVYYWQSNWQSPLSVDTGSQVTYTLAGLEAGQTYHFVVTAYDLSENESTFSNEISMTIPNTALPPVASFSASPTTGTSPLTVAFMDTSSGNITTRSWNFGDGTTSTAQHPTHTYNTAGTYTVSLTANGPGGSHTTTKSNHITVTNGGPGNRAPVAVNDTATTAEDKAVIISVLANDSDADGDGLTVVAVTPGSHGTVAINANKTVTYKPKATFTGTDSFTYTASDGRGATATGKVTITVNPGDPAVMIWFEAEEGLLQTPMKVGFDTEASGGQFVWVPDGSGNVLDPLQDGGFAKYSFEVPQADTYVIWGRVSPSAAGTGSFFISVVQEGQGEETVSAVTPVNYQVATAQVGTTYYIDRNYTIKALPAELVGLPLIKTANSDKSNQTAAFLTFTLSQDATLYVAYDARATRYPNWLTASYTKTGQTIATTDVPLAVWRRDVVAGTMSLPGNSSGAPSGGNSNYIVLVAFDPQGGAANPEPQYLMWEIPSQEEETGGTGTVSAVTPVNYQVATAQVGTTYYIDRNYTIKALPAELVGLPLIKTANSDKSNQTAAFLTFTLSQDATLYVAYDARATRYPNWLTASYTKTGQTIATTDVPLAVWRRDVVAGTMSLPGNSSGAPSGGNSNYIVLVAFDPQEPPQTWVWDQAVDGATPVFFLEPGSYTLIIKHREGGSKIDRILITNDLDVVP